MKKLLWTSLVALGVVALCQQEASAFFSCCGQWSGRWSFSCPRIIFGIDSGCAAPYTPISYGSPYGMNQAACGAMPWYAGYPMGGPGYAQTPAAPAAAQPAMAAPSGAGSATQPVSYRPGTYSSGINYHYMTGNGSAPSYWYGR